MVDTQEILAHLNFFNHSSLPLHFVLCPAILPAVGTPNFDVSASNQPINIPKRALKADRSYNYKTKTAHTSNTPHVHLIAQLLHTMYQGRRS